MHSIDAGVRVLSFRWSLRARLERLVVGVVWLLPHRLVYWCAIRVWANATSGKFGSESPLAVSTDDAIRRWERREGGDWTSA